LSTLILDARNDAYARGYTHARLQFEACGAELGGPGAGRFADRFATAIARNLPRNVYVAVTLFAGDVIFDEIGVLQAHEFDSEAVLDVTDHPALSLADGDHGADRRPQLGRNSDSRT
jgi:hypothetical protein